MEQDDVLNPEQQKDFVLKKDVEPTTVNDQKSMLPPDYEYTGDPSKSYDYPSDIDGTRPIKVYQPGETDTLKQDLFSFLNNIEIPSGDVIIGFILIFIIIIILAMIMIIDSKY